MRILLLLLFIFSGLSAYAQYPSGQQTLGLDSNVVRARGGLMARLINWSYPDTASANLERISFYDGSQIYTTSNKTLWLRKGNKWTTTDTLPTFSQYYIPVPNSLGKLAASTITYNPSARRLTIGTDGSFGTSSSFYINNGNVMISGSGWGSEYAIGQTNPADPSKSFGIKNGSNYWYKLRTNNDGTYRNKFELWSDMYPIADSAFRLGTLANRFRALYVDSVYIPTGASNGYVWTSDASGWGSWQPPTGGSGKLNISDTAYMLSPFVRKYGNETIAGVKTFSNQPNFSAGLISNQWTKLTAPASTLKMTLGSLTGVGLSVGGSSGVTYGLNVGVNVANGLTWLQSARWASGATAYHMTLQASGGNLGIGDVIPSEKLHLDGNFRLQGAFMPNNAAGTTGQILTSAGAGSSPTWVNKVAYKYPLKLNVSGDTVITYTATGTLTSSAGSVVWDYTTNINKTLSVTESISISVTNDEDGSVGVVLLTNSSGSPHELSFSGNATGMPALIDDGQEILCTYIRILDTRYWNYSIR